LYKILSATNDLSVIAVQSARRKKNLENECMADGEEEVSWGTEVRR